LATRPDGIVAIARRAPVNLEKGTLNSRVFRRLISIESPSQIAAKTFCGSTLNQSIKIRRHCVVHDCCKQEIRYSDVAGVRFSNEVYPRH
jgi:hypothetical protein